MPQTSTRLPALLCLFLCACLSACGPSAEFEAESVLDNSLNEYGVIQWSADSTTVDGFTIDRITIEPDIGEVDFQGMLEVYPAQTTTYKMKVETSNSNGLTYSYYRNATVYIGPRADFSLVEDDALRSCLQENGFTHLEQFDVLYCLGRGITSLEGVQQFQQARSASLDNNQLQDLYPLAALPELNTVSVSGSGLTSLDSLTQSTSIRNIAAHNNQLSDISALGMMPQLLNLTLDNNQISDTSPLDNIDLLQGLSIRFNQITDAGQLAVNTELLALDISDNPLSGGITELNTLTKATVIRSENNGGILCLDYAKLVLSLGPVVLFDRCKLF